MTEQSKRTGGRYTWVVVAHTCASVIAALVTFLVYRIYATRYGEAEFSAFLLFRLCSSLAVAIFTLGMPIALQRTVAFLAKRRRRASTAAVVGVVIGLGSLGIACGIASVFAVPIAALLEYPDVDELWRALMLFTVVQAAATMTILIAIARGRRLQPIFLLLATAGLSPLLALACAWNGSIDEVVLWTAFWCALFTSPSLLATIYWGLKDGLRRPLREAANLFRYGIPRSGSNALETILEWAPSWLAIAAGANLVEAGSLAIGLTLLRIMNPMTRGLNQLLVSSSARLAAAGDLQKQRQQAQRLSEFSLHVGLFAGVQLIIWCDFIARLFVGPDFTCSVTLIRITVCAFVAIQIFESQRGVIEGSSVRPVNMYHLVATLIVFATLSAAGLAAGLGVYAPAGAYVAARVSLAGLTIRHVVREFGVSLSAAQITTSVLTVCLIGLATLALRAVVPGNLEPVCFIALPLASFVVFAASMTLRHSNWAFNIAKEVGAAR